MRQLWGLGVLFTGLALAAELAKLEVNGTVQHKRNNAIVQRYSSSSTLRLEPGDQVCATKGSAKLTVQLRVYTLEPRRIPCFELARPRTIWDDLVSTCQDLGLCQKAAQEAFARPARSRGEGDDQVPEVLLPSNFRLKNLLLPIQNGFILRLYNDTTVLERQVLDKRHFVLPVALLKTATRLEVQNQTGAVIYASKVAQQTINLPNAGSAKDQALWLLTTKNTGFAPAAYSYALEAKDQNLSAAIEKVVHLEFVGIQ
jgi:hypothetical protein